MLPVGVWRREMVELRARRAPLVLGSLLSLALALPLLGSRSPAFHAAAACTALVALTGAVSAGRRAATMVAEGLPARLLATPASPYRLFVESLSVQVALDMVRVLPLLLAVGVRYHAGPGLFASLLLAAVPAMVLADLVGVAAGVSAHTRGEVPLYALAALLPALFLAGTFSPGELVSPVRELATALIPFTGLHHAMLAVTSGLPRAVGGPPPWTGWAASAVWLGVALEVLRRRLRRLR